MFGNFFRIYCYSMYCIIMRTIYCTFNWYISHNSIIEYHFNFIFWKFILFIWKIIIFCVIFISFMIIVRIKYSCRFYDRTRHIVIIWNWISCIKTIFFCFVYILFSALNQFWRIVIISFIFFITTITFFFNKYFFIFIFIFKWYNTTFY